MQPDPPKAHQYGYSARRSRRDAILQISVLLDRLQKAHVCTATVLYDLTKAFDMLSCQSVLADLEGDAALHPTLKALLVDMQQRLQIRLPIWGDRPLHVSLGAGVLQGGGTGPRLFRRVYDGVVQEWQHNGRENATLTEVQYNGYTYDVSVAAYADDLARVEAAAQLTEVERNAIAHTDALAATLRPHRLRLNLSKSECLLAVRGKGAYAAAKRAFSGGWQGPPLKSAVKYLGAHLQPNLSCRLEVTKRIAAARTGFARFSSFFKNSHIPQHHKNMVFKSVVNEALLSALEVRTLTSTDIQRLEAARGVLLRRSFGRAGFGAVQNEAGHRSVPVSELRHQCGLADVASELRVRRLLWLRSALTAEQLGEVRLDLAALFGHLTFQRDAPVSQTGALTETAPLFLRLLHEDLQALVQGWLGFIDGWQQVFLGIPRSAITQMRNRAVPPEPAADEPRAADRIPRPIQQTVIPGTPSATAAELCVLSDGRTPDNLGEVSAAEWLAGAYCGTCASGPWHSRKAFFQHVIKGHSVRHELQSKTCPRCGRNFTEKSACRRHVEHDSCGSVVNNHGLAGAVAGRTASSADLAQSSSDNPVIARPASRQLDVRASLHGRAESGSQQPDGRHQSQASSSRAGARSVQREPRAASAAPDQSAASSGQSRAATRQGHERVRSMELPNLFAQQRQQSCQRIAFSHANLEVQGATQRPSSHGSSEVDRGRDSGPSFGQ